MQSALRENSSSSIFSNFKDGRPKKFTQEQIELALGLLRDGKTYREVERMTGISKSTMVRARKIYK